MCGTFSYCIRIGFHSDSAIILLTQALLILFKISNEQPASLRDFSTASADNLESAITDQILASAVSGGGQVETLQSHLQN